MTRSFRQRSLSLALLVTIVGFGLLPSVVYAICDVSSICKPLCDNNTEEVTGTCVVGGNEQNCCGSRSTPTGYSCKAFGGQCGACTGDDNGVMDCPNGESCCMPHKVAAQGGGTCTCSGTISAGALLPNATFDGYCASAKQYCPECGNGSASCSYTAPATKAECDSFNADPEGVLSKQYGIPSAAFALISTSISCTYTEAGSAASAASVCAAGNGNFSLQLPACVKDGRCTLNDIVCTATAFANLLMSLSGVLFFAAFIYGGAMYLLSFGRSEWVSKGTKAMVGAAIGMGIVLSAWTIVNYIASSLTGKI